MSPVHTLRARGQKRKRPPSESTSPSGEPPWKRAGFRSAEEANTAFYDNLPRVHLFPRALRELDRRNRLSVPTTTKAVGRSAPPTTKSATRRAAQANQPSLQRNTVLKERAAQLKRFAGRGGPDLRDLRGCPEPSGTSPTMSLEKDPSNPNKSIMQAGTAKRASAYNPGFEEHLINHGIYPPRYSHLNHRGPVKPNNWEELQQEMEERRPSVSLSQFSDGVFEDFATKAEQAKDEADVIRQVFPLLEGDTNIPSGSKTTFNNLMHLTDGTIVDAQPDLYYGAQPSQLDPRIRTQSKPYIVPSVNSRAPILPNFFTEKKGPKGTSAVAKRQACYDGAIGARGMQHLQSYSEPEPVYDNNAYTIASTFDGSLLQMYTTHLTAPANPEDRPKYHMNQLNAWGMTGEPEVFRKAVTAYRNVRDWAKRMRDEFIKAANERLAAKLPESTSTNSVGPSVSDTSANERSTDNLPQSTSTSRFTNTFESDTSAANEVVDEDVMILPSGRRG